MISYDLFLSLVPPQHNTLKIIEQLSAETNNPFKVITIERLERVNLRRSQIIKTIPPLGIIEKTRTDIKQLE